jgi:hypothetical protein
MQSRRRALILGVLANEGLHWLIADASGRAVLVEFDLSRRMVVLDRPGPYELMTNTALQKGDAYVSSVCPRFRLAQPLLEAGLSSTGDMLNMMRSIRRHRVTLPGRSGRPSWTWAIALWRRITASSTTVPTASSWPIPARASTRAAMRSR